MGSLLRTAAPLLAALGLAALVAAAAAAQTDEAAGGDETPAPDDDGAKADAPERSDDGRAHAPERPNDGRADAPERPNDGRATALVSRLVLKVIDPAEVRAGLSDAARELGGFPVLITNDSLTVKVPPEQLDAMLEAIGGEGRVLEKTLEREDLTEEIAQLQGRLKSKRAILVKLRSFFDDSNVAATLRIEQTMTDLVQEIEQVKGRLRVLGERSRFAVIEISFRFKQRDRIIYVHSPFEWLNSVNLDRFLEEF